MAAAGSMLQKLLQPFARPARPTQVSLGESRGAEGKEPELSDEERRCEIVETFLRRDAHGGFGLFFASGGGAAVVRKVSGMWDARVSDGRRLLAPGDTVVQVPPDEMVYIRDNLTHAETARRKGDTATVYAAYSNLAQYFQERSGDPKTGVYFYEKCHEIARLTGDHRGEMAANHDLGLAHTIIGDVDGATRYHERHLEMARGLDDHREMRAASKQLIDVYRAAAEEREAAGDADAAAREHERCIEAARNAGDAQAEARAALALGRALVVRGEEFASEAVRTLETAELLCSKLGDAEGEGRASAALAAAWRAKGDDDRAREYLERCLEHAQVTDDLAAQAAACRTLGALHSARGDFNRAVELLQRNFSIARQLLASGDADTALVDRARVHLGIALGNEALGNYLRALQTDFPALLAWKNGRDALPAAEKEDKGDEDEEDEDEDDEDDEDN